MKHDSLYAVLGAAILALSIVPVGGAVFVLGFAFGDSPCVLCWEERIGMVIVCLLGLFVMRYGPKPRYVGLSVIVSAWGLFMALRHTASHVARDLGQGFSTAILGAHTYTWAILIYWTCILATGVLIMMVKEGDRLPLRRASGLLDRVVMPVFLVVVAANVIQAFAGTGPPPFVGQADPVRFSFNPANWVWSMEEWSAAPLSWRGRWAVDEPDLARLDPDPATGPLAHLRTLRIVSRQPMPLALQGTPTGLAYDDVSDRFLITTQHGVYIADGSFGRVLRYTIVDAGYSVDVGRFAGAAFLGSGTVMAVSENKSFVVLKERERAAPAAHFRFFLESPDAFDEVSRSRLSTVRARMMYILSLAFDAGTESLFTFTVPNGKSRRLVVSRFDRRDLTLSAEFSPSLPASATSALQGPDRSLDELYVTAATFSDGRLYGLSAAHATLLAIDPGRGSVVAGYAIPGLVRPTGIARKGDRFHVVSADGTVFIVEAPDAQVARPSDGR